jgi:GAF domain-containing protein
MLQLCAEAVVGRLDAAFARVWTLDRPGVVLTLRASAGLYTHLDGGHARVNVGEFKIGRIAQRRLPHLSNDIFDDPELSDPDWARQEGMVAFAGYPLLIGDEVVGVLGLFARHTLSDSTLEVLEAVADSLALGIRRASVESELRVHGEVSEILYRAGTAIRQLHRTDPIVQTATDLATELTGAQFGAFFYNVLDEHGEALMVYTLSGAAREAFAGFPLPRNTAIFEPTFRGTGIERHDDVTKDPRFGRNAPLNGMPDRHLPVRSYLAVPVISRTGDVIGGLLFGHGGVGVFDERAERIAVGIAGHAGAALDTVRLFEIEHRLALNFQRTLLAGEVPHVAGVRFAQQYVPASDLAAVGGDWYDITTLPDGRVSLTIGDVVGHDLRAAVTMGRLRNALQLYTIEGYGPAAALQRTDAYMDSAGMTDTATVLHAILDPATLRLTMSRAGHPPPLIQMPGAGLAALDIDDLPGALLGTGTLSHRPRLERTYQLEAGSVVVFYTDGLVERPGTAIDDRITELSRIATEALASGNPFCDTVVHHMVGESPNDDVAMVALFVDPA